jgi:hypothetical protein
MKIGLTVLFQVEAAKNRDSLSVRLPWLVGYDVDLKTIGILIL